MPKRRNKCKRRYPLNETEEQKKERLRITALKAKIRRANQTPEKKAERRRREAQRVREKRAAMSETALAARRQRDAIMKKERRARETEEEKALRRSKEAMKARERRAKLLAKLASAKVDQVNDLVKEEIDIGDISQFLNINISCEISEGDSKHSSDVEDQKISTNNENSNVCNGNNNKENEDQDLSHLEPVYYLNMAERRRRLKFSNSSLAEKQTKRKSGPQECDLCGLTFWKDTLRKHKMRDHGYTPTYDCRICDRKFNRRGDATKHRRLEHCREEDGLYFCHLCGKSSVELHNLITHMKVHNSKLDPETGEELRNPRKRRSSTKVVCELCGESFKSIKTLNKHRITEHQESELLDFHTSGAKQPITIKPKPYKCDKCPKSFSYMCLLRYHVSKHFQMKPWACDKCGRSFQYSGSLTHHMRIHEEGENFVENHSKIFKCEGCNEHFQSVHALTEHSCTSGVSPYSSNLCNKSFLNETELIVHETKHKQKNFYKCDICGQRFEQNELLKQHKKIHTDEFPFHCRICSDRFGQSAQFASHVKVVHPEELQKFDLQNMLLKNLTCVKDSD